MIFTCEPGLFPPFFILLSFPPSLPPFSVPVLSAFWFFSVWSFQFSNCCLSLMSPSVSWHPFHQLLVINTRFSNRWRHHPISSKFQVSVFSNIFLLIILSFQVDLQQHQPNPPYVFSSFLGFNTCVASVMSYIN